jgi:hypothetical protein
VSRARLSCLVLSLAGCADVLDLQDATLDPSLSQGGTNAIPIGGSGEGGAGGASGAALCASYCATVDTNCSGAFAVYGSLETCLAVCAALPAGEPGDQSGNTIHCRLRSAENAAAEPAYYCALAGPGGNGVCGTNCEGLCALTEAICVDDDAQWPSRAACLGECAELTDLGTYSIDSDAGMYAGDHVQCRLFHASASALADPAIHCDHAGGTPPCAPEPIGGGGDN